MPPPPSEPRPLYEVIPEVKSKIGGSSDIYSASHGYQLPSSVSGGSGEAEVNISKTQVSVDNTKASIAEKEEEKKKKEKEKKHKYKVKF